MIRVISPHLDDAILSLGQTIAGAHAPVEIVTVFAGPPKAAVLTEYDKGCGFVSSADAVAARRDEDSAAAFIVGARTKHLNFLDRQYELERDEETFEQIVSALSSCWADDDGKPCYVLAPVGVGHPDHVIVRHAALRAWPDTVNGSLVGLWLYEELPYRVLHPDVTVHLLDSLREQFDVDTVVEPWEQGPLDAKSLAIAEYRSQFPDGAADPCLLVPERSWRLMKKER